MKIDIVSDVVCPWCVVGYRQLEEAMQKTDIEAEIHWHPFELNPKMPEAGQNLQEHICEKYGTSVEQSNENRQQLVDVGQALGIVFGFNNESRMVNTFNAHQLLHWAKLNGFEHELKLALFSAYFTLQQDINDPQVLADVVAAIDQDPAEATAVLEEGRYQSEVRQHQVSWTDRGIQGVPAMVFNDKYLVTGAQGVESYTAILREVAAK